MFKYQKETLKNLETCAKKLENITDRTYRMKIGTYKDSYWNGSNWINYNDDLYLYVNKNYNLKVVDTYNDYIIVSLESDDMEGVLNLNKNVYLNLNKLIDRIYKDIKEDKKNHALLNQKLGLILKNL